jgi:hypothetical protein
VTREESLAVASMLVEAYPREVKAETLKAYAMHLADLERDAAVRAVKTLVATSKWLPTIAEVRAAVVAQDARFLSAPDAWDQVVQLMAKRGTYRPLPRGSGDPVRRALELCGRWEDVCQEDATWLRKRYVEIYDGLVLEARQGLASGDPPHWLALPETTRPALPAPITVNPTAARLNARAAERAHG